MVGKYWLKIRGISQLETPCLSMFLAALTSAWAWWPQARHRNSAWVARFPAAGVPVVGAPLGGVTGADCDPAGTRFPLERR
jgi:hypothetical protein